jgi:hypothetical protein
VELQRGGITEGITEEIVQQDLPQPGQLAETAAVAGIGDRLAGTREFEVIGRSAVKAGMRIRPDSES